jgi:hypothetical protein
MYVCLYFTHMSMFT